MITYENRFDYSFSFILVLPCYSELTKQDLDKISNLIDRKLEPIKQELFL